MTTYQSGFDCAIEGRWPQNHDLKDRDFARGYKAGREEIKRTAAYRNAPVPDTDRMDAPRGKRRDV